MADTSPAVPVASFDEHWSPRDYLDQFYPPTRIHADELAAVKSQIEFTRATLRDAPVVLEFGSGPAVHRAIAAYREPAAWRALQRAGMRRDFGWAASARRYVDLYQALGRQSKSTRSARSRPRPGSSGAIR